MGREINEPIKFTYDKHCEICGEKIEAWTQPMCYDCLEVLKELILEKKEYIKKYKNGQD